MKSDNPMPQYMFDKTIGVHCSQLNLRIAAHRTSLLVEESSIDMDDFFGDGALPSDEESWSNEAGAVAERGGWCSIAIGRRRAAWSIGPGELGERVRNTYIDSSRMYIGYW